MSDPVAGSVESSFQVRNNNLSEIKRMCDYFLSQANEYNRFLYLRKIVARDSRVNAIVFIILGPIIAFIGFMIFLGSLSLSLTPSFTDSSVNPVLYFIFPLIWGAPFMILGIIFIILFCAKNSVRKKRLPGEIKERDEVLNALWDNYVNFGPCLLGFEYTFPEPLSEIKDLLISGRADTIKEALNTMHDDKHKRQMEELSAATARFAAQAAAAATISAINSF